MWFWLTDRHRYDDNVKDDDPIFASHIIPDVLKEPILGDLIERGLTTHKIETIVEVHIDLPGMVWAKRTLELVELDGLRLKIPSEDFHDFFTTLEHRKSVVSAGVSYYKLHGHLRCICLTPTLRTMMLHKMGAMLKQADKHAADDDRRFSEQLSKGTQ